MAVAPDEQSLTNRGIVRHIRIKLAVAILLVCPLPLASQAPRLGEIDFPVTAGDSASRLFEQGVLWLHSFEYQRARDSFREAFAAEPRFVMAVWGEAMTWNHPVWNRRFASEARDALLRLGPTREERLALAPTERERRYLAAVETLFESGEKATRDTMYAREMEALAALYPDDVEARAFYALSLLGLNQGVRDFRNYMRAAATVLPVFQANPRHPGAAHYLIHAFDDPIHAPLGLPAAKAYSSIAPDAAHAQHMTTHIFLALGMWDEVVAQNTIAMNLTHRGPGHYTSWLNYGLIQQGRWRDAVDQLVVAQVNLADDDSPGGRAYLARMRAHYLVNTERWDDAVIRWDIDLEEAGGRTTAQNAFALGYGALRRGLRETAAAWLRQLEAIEASQPGPPEPAPKEPEILRLLLQAGLLFDEGRNEAALLSARKAALIEDELPLEFGPPDVVKPSHELLGEFLLELGRPVAAAREFTRALELAPGRARSLLGLIRASTEAGDEPTAQRALDRLAAIWHRADPEARLLALPAALSSSQ